MRQAREAVDALGHHPSIVQWCAHDEPVADAPQVEGDGRGRRVRRFVRQQLPTWNKSVLDRWVKRAFEQADPTRPTIAHGGVLPHLPQLDGTDSHLWLGWHRGEIHELADTARTLPRLVRFVSEFGAQSVPASAGEFVDATPWPDLDWERLARHHGLEVDVMLARHPPERFAIVRRLAHRDPALPGRAAAAPHRDAAPAQVPARPAGSASRGWPTRPR